MKKWFITALLGLLPFLSFAQIPQRLEIASIDRSDREDMEELVLEAFWIPREDHNDYYLSVGNADFNKNKVLFFDPLTEGFIYAGTSVDDVLNLLSELIELVSDKKGATKTFQGEASVAYPRGDMGPVLVEVANKGLLGGKRLDFIIASGDRQLVFRRTAFDLKSLNTSVKLYKKLHPNQK